jgi:diguanylate cyclase (GGDEF)-like protein/PAS domain S-box-containing protein
MMEMARDFYKDLIESMYCGVYFVDRTRKVTYWNPGAERITGFLRDEVIGTNCSDNLLQHVDTEGNRLCQGKCPLAATIDDGQEREVHAFLRHKDGHRLPVQIRTAPIYDEAGEAIGAVEIFMSDRAYANTQRRVSDLQRLAMIDPVTRLMTQAFVQTTLFGRLEALERFGWKFGVMIAEIDRFADLVSERGQEQADQLVRVLATTFLNTSRPFDVVAHWSDHGMLVLIENADAGQLESIAKRYCVLAAQSGVRGKDKPLKSTVSIGATLAHSGDALESLIDRAEKALARSADKGGNRVSVE